MYVRTYHHELDPQVVLQFLKEHPFAVLVSASERFPQASHIPIEVLEDASGGLKLMGHVSNSNPQLAWIRSFPDVLVIFQGPNTYVSASWYPVPEVASTWNYLAVHVCGKLTVVDSNSTLAHLRRITDRYEKKMARPMSVDRMTEEYLSKNLQAITGFRIEAERVENTYKLSQNKDERTREQVIRELDKSGSPGASAIAAEMAARIPHLKK
jgi:transcriptional regulator